MDINNIHHGHSGQGMDINNIHYGHSGQGMIYPCSQPGWDIMKQDNIMLVRAGIYLKIRIANF